ncbi:MAG: FAD-dependent oxidoreductase [Bacteroidetes bacterium]|jgi:thioredoxin reductase|nr:FAD-dependent oxidoreductase [Bacteroidota bacterium]
MTVDVLIVGAGPAGLTAALVLARAGRDVLVLDGGPGRNAPAAHSHNVFTREGASPTELRRIGRTQAESYGARFLEQEAVRAEADEDGVRVQLADGSEMKTRRLLLATGVEDLLPEIPGVAEAWGETVVHCPYCHGFELRERPTAVLDAGEKGVHLSGLLLGWTDHVTLCCGPDRLSGDERQRLTGLGVDIDERPVAALGVEGRDVRTVVFEDDSQIDATAVYIQPDQRPRGPLPDALGLEHTELGHVRVDEFMRTSAPGVSACGDVTSPMQAVQIAASSGFTAAAFLNNDLIDQGRTYTG